MSRTQVPAHEMPGGLKPYAGANDPSESDISRSRDQQASTLAGPTRRRPQLLLAPLSALERDARA